MKANTYNHIVKSNTESIYRFVLKMVSDSDTAKDLTQDAFIKLWEERNHVNELKAKAWLFTTAYRLSLAYLKNKKRFLPEEFIQDMEVTASDTPDINGIIDQSLLLLSEMQKSVLLLKDYEGYQYNEIADILEISGDSVKVHLFRARKKIKDHLKDLRLVI